MPMDGFFEHVAPVTALPDTTLLLELTMTVLEAVTAARTTMEVVTALKKAVTKEFQRFQKFLDELLIILLLTDPADLLTMLLEAVMVLMDPLMDILDFLTTLLEVVTVVLDVLDSLTVLTEVVTALLEAVTAVLDSLDFLTAVLEALPEEAAPESTTTTGYSMIRPRCPKNTPMLEATAGTDGASRPGAISYPSARPCSRSLTGSSDVTSTPSPRR